ncbi:MAG: catechol 1,2-dioxygenase [Pseudonocardia sp.]|uniref:dioxygenase family protein n=1 Tax=unclassified Pseudonocardia TaxID=2619320 RepID=UPI00086844D4|nr:MULTISPECIES: dioxygenase [unclassified Pseudonocardia]MBN9108192.1 catechol 1,2-dioxygenase [Pseudonocardia sp.]ODU22450.1 MAG: catechol 1,2-dioxygenase [Pseudonocardia sp. SCN 72-51]ODV01673.1 MAG: catechol 1,2-dioxygenase [Pseudonocardia sp. SCN 73-27]
MTTIESPTAAASGASASRAVRDATARHGQAATSQERLDTVARAVLGAVHDVIREHQVTYPEFQAAKRWLMALGESGEWPLFLDVFVEHVVEQVAAESQQGTVGSIEGPYFLPGQARLPAVCTLPMRDDEPGTPLVFAGQVRALDGTPLADAEIDIWQNAADGFYSGFAPHLPDGLLRGVVTTDGDGRFEVTTILPAPYQIPTDGPTGTLIENADWHPWRPAHLHLMVRAEGHRTVTTQLYFTGGEYLDDDVANAVKDDLVLDPAPGSDGRLRVEYDFVLERA